ncbi:uncharacterized protein LOC124124973 [Haliotis rufescens]|uniref:uncharacterized protein LOC124124973 n=1 Tax=Haliotis rufescens TaxID=6454 RepID=UPI00201EF929|nr:uncharacterized protein LOC124124973 [Haliotis rufescens]
MSALFLVTCGLSVDVITASLCADIGSMVLPTGVGLHAFKKVHMTGLYPCAAECTSTSKCTSFNYCLKTRMCELIRETTPSSAEGGPTEGCMYVDQWPNDVAGPCATLMCPELSVCRVNRLNQASCIHECENPPYLDNAVLTVAGYHVGASASYICKPNHMFCGTGHQLRCDTSGQWNGTVGTCGRTVWTDPEVPFIEPLPCEFTDKYNLRIVGTPLAETRFAINLKQDTALLLQVDARFNSGNSIRKIVLSTGDSTIPASFINEFPFITGQTFTMDLVHTDTDYQVFINGTFVGGYTDHNPGQNPNIAEVKLDVSVQTVLYTRYV